MARSMSDSNLTKDLFQEEYTHEFVGRWDELINWRGRWESEGGFFPNVLRKHDAESVLDVACGTGFHTVMLSREGFDVVGADGSAEMVDKARENAQRADQPNLPIVQAEWTTLTETFPNQRFDAIICLGNAFTHLFDEEDRKQALNEMYKVLNDDGVLIIDHRNYDKILDKEYESKHQHYYLGKTVDVHPEEVNDKFVRLRYQYNDGSSYHLTLSTIRQDYVTNLLKEAGMKEVHRYGDFNSEYSFYDPDFIIQVARK